jgi:hypothetical protein
MLSEGVPEPFAALRIKSTSPFISFRINSSQLKAFSWLSERPPSEASRFREGIPERSP